MAIFAIVRWIGMSTVASGQHGHFFVLIVDVELLGPTDGWRRRRGPQSDRL